MGEVKRGSAARTSIEPVLLEEIAHGVDELVLINSILS
jgi:hypothetical protein